MAVTDKDHFHNIICIFYSKKIKKKCIPHPQKLYKNLSFRWPVKSVCQQQALQNSNNISLVISLLQMEATSVKYIQMNAKKSRNLLLQFRLELRQSH